MAEYKVVEAYETPAVEAVEAQEAVEAVAAQEATETAAAVEAVEARAAVEAVEGKEAVQHAVGDIVELSDEEAAALGSKVEKAKNWVGNHSMADK